PPWTRYSSTIGFPLSEQNSFLEALRKFHERLDTLSEGQRDVAGAVFLAPLGRWNDLIDAVSTYVSGAELDRVSSRDLNRYNDSGVNWRVVEGYGAVIATHGSDLPVVLGCPVRLIDHRARRLKLDTKNGAVTSDAAIITVPSSLIAEEKLLFAPELPEKTKAAMGLPLGLADKLFLSLSDADEFDEDSRLFGRTDRSGTGVLSLQAVRPPADRGVFRGTLGG
ncbi:MAG: FAD-dependent oxidoreductase, partial [Rhodoplanes sp.]